MVAQKIGGVQGSGNTGLVSGDFDILGKLDDTNADVLILGPTNGASNGSGATGYKVVIEGDASTGLSGSVAYANVVTGPVVTFNGFELFSFIDLPAVGATNNDVVDATAVTSDLTLDTGIGDDNVRFGGGNDTFVIGKGVFGADVVDGGAGHDTLDLSALSGAARKPLTFHGTNLFQTNAYVVERTDAPANKVTFTAFEAIRSGGGDDVFTAGYAAQTLKTVDLGAGDDTFGWLAFNGSALDIDAGRGTDTVKIGGNSGSGRTGLIDGTVAGGMGVDTLMLGVTNGHSGATGFKVVIEDDATSTMGFSGSVRYTDGAQVVGGPGVTFTGFEAFTFDRGVPASNGDHVDATRATRALSLDTAAGDDIVAFGGGNDTFVIGSRTFGADVADGGAGHDTLDMSALSGAGRSNFTFTGVNFSRTTDSVVTRDDSAGNSVTFSNFEAIKAGGGIDTFNGGYADEALQRIDMGDGDDLFAWNTRDGDRLDIGAGRGNDTVEIGGTPGAGGTGLIDGTVDGGEGKDTLYVRYNNTDGATGNGFKVMFTGDNAGTVTYRGDTSGPATDFNSFESIVFGGFNRRNYLDDVVDASASKAGLTINTAAGKDTIIVGAGNDLLTGGKDADLFVFVGVFGKDVITDFNVAEDMIALDTAVTGVSTSNGDTIINTAMGQITLNDVTGLDIGSILNTDHFA